MYCNVNIVERMDPFSNVLSPLLLQYKHTHLPFAALYGMSQLLLATSHLEACKVNRLVLKIFSVL